MFAKHTAFILYYNLWSYKFFFAQITVQKCTKCNFLFVKQKRSFGGEKKIHLSKNKVHFTPIASAFITLKEKGENVIIIIHLNCFLTYEFKRNCTKLIKI